GNPGRDARNRVGSAESHFYALQRRAWDRDMHGPTGRRLVRGNLDGGSVPSHRNTLESYREFGTEIGGREHAESPAIGRGWMRRALLCKRVEGRPGVELAQRGISRSFGIHDDDRKAHVGSCPFLALQN